MSASRCGVTYSPKLAAQRELSDVRSSDNLNWKELQILLLRQKANQVTRKRGLNYVDTESLSTDEIVCDASKVSLGHISIDLTG